MSTKFEFNGANRKVKVKRAIASQMTQNATCNPIPCGGDGCMTKVK